MAPVTRRDFGKAAGLAGLGAAVPALLTGCSSDDSPRTAQAAAAQAAAAQGGMPQQGARPAQAPQMPPQRPVRAAPKVGRNQPCPCGSGKKFKNCHGVLEGVE